MKRTEWKFNTPTHTQTYASERENLMRTFDICVGQSTVIYVFIRVLALHFVNQIIDFMI